MSAVNPVKKPSSSPLDQALRFLSFRPRSEAEVASYLKRKKISPENISAIINKLKDLQLIDDYKFCLWWQEARDRSRPTSSRLLQFELRRKGIPIDIITRAIDNSTITDLKRAQAALESKRITAHKDQFLARRGFSWDIIQLTLKDIQGTI